MQLYIKIYLENYSKGKGQEPFPTGIPVRL